MRVNYFLKCHVNKSIKMYVVCVILRRPSLLLLIFYVNNKV